MPAAAESTAQVSGAMIYIFRACGALCMAPCKLCECCARGCDKTCKGCGDACRRCTKACEEMWEPILKNPLGHYVIGTWVAMALAIGCNIRSLCNTHKLECTELKTFNWVDIAIGVVHAGFALYIQRRLVAHLSKQGKPSMTNAEIAASARELVKYDVGLCLYVFGFMAAFCYNCYGVGNVGDCSETGFQRGAVAIHVCWGLGAWWYGLCWFCGKCCFGQAEQAREKVKAKGAPAAHPVDGSAA